MFHAQAEAAWKIWNQWADFWLRIENWKLKIKGIFIFKQKRHRRFYQ
jgi:hypothetical protein